MKKSVKNNSRKGIAVFLALIMILGALMLSGCDLLTSCNIFDISVSGVEFNESELTLELGEEKDINASVVKVSPRTASNRDFTVTSDNPTVIEVVSSSNKIRAVSLGNANITATSVSGNHTDTIPITVVYADVKSISIQFEGLKQANGVIIVPFDDIKPIDFSAKISDNADPEHSVSWVVGASQAIEKKTSEKFTFTPSAKGSYSISAAVKNEDNQVILDTVKVNVCEPFVAIGSHDGVMRQKSGEYQKVSFSLAYTNPEGNPAAIVEWFVNGEQVSAAEQFAFTPKIAGDYKIEAKVNGVAVSFGKENEAHIYAEGSIVPTNVSVEFDNSFPKVFVRWDNIPSNVGYEIQIKNLTTGVIVADNLNTKNPSVANLFTSNSFDASNYINTKSSNVFNSAFEVKMRTLGDGDALVDSNFSSVVSTAILPLNARDYLDTKYYDGNCNMYITSDEEFIDWFSYSMLWRDPSNTVKQKLFMAYQYGDQTIRNKNERASQFVMDAFQYAAFTSRCNLNGVASGNILEVYIDFMTDGKPSLKTQQTAGDKAFGSIRPHINYDDSLVRADSFPIDQKTPVRVTTSDQLYFTAQNGYKPAPTIGSSAESLYNYARRTLRYIITDDMSDVEKAHAIYDWIMWRVSYDHEVLKIDGGDANKTLELAVKYEAYYLEGVLTDVNFYAVCDGMAKAYSLMCNIEGIPCVRVSGEGYSSGTDSWGGHAWNKVFVDNAWYVVDCTWGDMAVPVGTEQKESASHMFFLLTDAEVKADHKESDPRKYPRTPSVPYNWYAEDFDYGDSKLNYYIGDNVADAEDARQLVDYMLDNMKGASKEYAVGADKTFVTNKTYTQYYAYDIRVTSRLARVYSSKTTYNPLVAALKAHNLILNRDYYLKSATMDEVSNDVCLFLFIKIK